MTIIFENLIDNSLKFARTDVTPQIDIEIKKTNARVNIKVVDNGIGIHEDYRNKIFDMFFIGTTEGKGLGLGLHAVQLAVKKMKGTVKLVESNLWTTQFLVDIPEHI
jgi:signal transduction histidine kinase